MGKTRGNSRDGFDRRTHRSRRQARHAMQRRLLYAFCALVMLACALYMGFWFLQKAKIERSNAEYSALYAPETRAPSEQRDESAPDPNAASPSNTGSAGRAPAPDSSDADSAPRASAANSSETLKATRAPIPSPTSPATAAAPTPSPSRESTRAPQPTVQPFEIVLDATRAPLATPDANTRVYALETPPPVQETFAELLRINDETIGFLKIGDALSLPVVQRENDNEYYLNHSFEQEESNAGTLFLDGANLLVPEDDSLIVYGHNMRNGTMFHTLCAYDQLPFLQAHAVVDFDTIYQNRKYVPFAALTVTADPGSARYLNLRQFALDEAGFERYVDALRRLSVWDIPVDVRYGDSLLLLVTCEYTHDNGRFVVALRALRPDESEVALRTLVQNTKAK